MAGDGYNVVIHEFAHKLDMLNGDADGMPALHGDLDESEMAGGLRQHLRRFLPTRGQRRGHPDRSLRQRNPGRVLRRAIPEAFSRSPTLSPGNTLLSTTCLAATTGRTAGPADEGSQRIEYRRLLIPLRRMAAFR